MMKRHQELFNFIQSTNYFNSSDWDYQSGGGNPELGSPQTRRLLFLLQTPNLHRPLDVATVPLKDGAQSLQQNHTGGASHGAPDNISLLEPSFQSLVQVDADPPP